MYYTKKGFWSGYSVGQAIAGDPSTNLAVNFDLSGGRMWKDYKKILKHVSGTKGEDMGMQLVCHEVGAPRIAQLNRSSNFGESRTRMVRRAGGRRCILIPSRCILTPSHEERADSL